MIIFIEFFTFYNFCPIQVQNTNKREELSGKYRILNMLVLLKNLLTEGLDVVCLRVLYSIFKKINDFLGIISWKRKICVHLIYQNKYVFGIEIY